MQGKFVIGNWKMYKTQQQAREFVEEFAGSRATEVVSDVWSGIAVPFTLIDIVQSAAKAKNCSLHIGAQNMHPADQGAFTGEIALEMLIDRGAEFAILGHSERRLLFHESDALINKKVQRALHGSFRSIVCIGESAEENREGQTNAVLERQLSDSLRGVESAHLEHLMIAYEPVWAIGTGQMADLAHVERAHLCCRTWLLAHFPECKVPLLYGGSVSPRNARELRDASFIDGILAGSSSLSAGEFKELIQAFSMS